MLPRLIRPGKCQLDRRLICRRLGAYVGAGGYVTTAPERVPRGNLCATQAEGSGDSEDWRMPDKFNVPAANGDDQLEVALDVKTARRMLAWVNAANRPEDLMWPPDVFRHPTHHKRALSPRTGRIC
jgi:hypothetical protein